MYENHAGEKFTPIEGPVRFFLDRLKMEMGTWGAVADASNIKRRYMRTIRNHRVTISMSVLDRIVSGCQTSTTLDDFTWYTPEDLVKMGLWKELPEGEDFGDEGEEEE